MRWKTRPSSYLDTGHALPNEAFILPRHRSCTAKRGLHPTLTQVMHWQTRPLLSYLGNGHALAYEASILPWQRSCAGKQGLHPTLTQVMHWQTRPLLSYLDTGHALANEAFILPRQRSCAGIRGLYPTLAKLEQDVLPCRIGPLLPHVDSILQDAAKLNRTHTIWWTPFAGHKHAGHAHARHHMLNTLP
eukprot:1157301-Pelagomonas_calceolata.AAC.8